MFIIKLATHALLLCLSFILANLGLDWIELGYGLNPWIAFPVAAIIFAFVVYHVMRGIYEEHQNHKQQQHQDQLNHQRWVKDQIRKQSSSNMTFPHY
jgi:phosphate/sulfate permease